MGRRDRWLISLWAACSLLLLWQINLSIGRLRDEERMHRSTEDAMADPAENELKTSWLTGYDAQHHPTYWTVTTPREAGETVTHWIDRHSQACKDAAELHPPYKAP